MSAREHDPSKVVLDIEAAYVRKLARHERTIIEREDARHRRRLAALGPGPQFQDTVLGFVDLAAPVGTPEWHREQVL